jgi:type II secretory pathway pseudopilin PulG
MRYSVFSVPSDHPSRPALIPGTGRPARRRAFVLAELLVAFSMLAILSSLVIVNYSVSRQRARDGRRKTDVRAYLSGLENFRLTHANYFVTDSEVGNCVVPVAEMQTDVDITTLNTQPGCVGAGGRAYGKMNAMGETVSGYTPTSYGYTFAAHTYPAVSIAEALKKGGYMANVAIDPKAAVDQRDYHLVRCCVNGKQSVADSGQYVAVWAKLEQAPSAQENDNTERYCGGITNSPPNPPNYQFDFGGGQSRAEAFAGGYAYALGNQTPRGRLSLALGGVCQ